MNRAIPIIILSLIASLCVSAQEIDCIDSTKFYSKEPLNLSSLKYTTQNAEIIGLGESTHNAGTTFDAKAKVIKYLHDSLGYNILVFESGLFDCEYANELMKKGDTQVQTLLNGVFSLWWTREVSDLFRYVISTQKTSNPIKFAGMDIQSLRYSDKFLDSVLKQFVIGLNKKYKTNITISKDFSKSLQKAIKYSNTFAKLPIKDTIILYKTFTQIIKSIDTISDSDAPELQFWKMLCQNLITDYRRQYYKKIQIRDSMMAENISYLKSRYKERMMIWSASIHLSKDYASINDKAYSSPTTGYYLKKTYHDKYYFIAFTPHHGRGGVKDKGLFSYKFDVATNGSIEDYISKTYNCDFALLPVSYINFDDEKYKHIKKTKFFWRKEIAMNIPEICDAVFYIKEMHAPDYSSN